MRHRKAGVKLNRTTSHRQAMFRNMVTSLFKYDRIRTTDVKAKELRRWADHIITLAKQGDLNARRQALAIVREKDVVHKLFEDAEKRFGKINGGYTRIIKIGIRPGDAAPVSLIELVEQEDQPKKKKAPAKKQTAITAAKKAKDKPAQKAAAEVSKKEVQDAQTSDAQAAVAEDETAVEASEAIDVADKTAASKADEKKATPAAATKASEKKEIIKAEATADKGTKKTDKEQE
jgi:large subunit ribosomal protein L17